MRYRLKFFRNLTILLTTTQTYLHAAVSQDTTTVIKITAKEYKEQSFPIQYPFFGTSIKLDAKGEGIIILPVKSNTFTELTVNTEAIKLFLEPGKDVHLTIKDNNFFFTGKGAESNNYLMNSIDLLKKLNDSITVMKERNYAYEKFIATYNSFESIINKFHELYCDSISFPNDIAYLLKNNVYALLLTEKQNYLSSFSKREIDSLDLENKLGLLKNMLYQDSLLMRANSMDFKNFLFLHHYYYELTQGIASPEQIEAGLYPIICNQIIRERYGSAIQEFLLFTDLTINIQFFGITPVLDSIARNLKEIYPSSEYQHTVETRYKEFQPLAPGKDAPGFRNKALNGKLYDLNDFKGKVILIDVWATWCGACIKSFPSVCELQKEFKNKDIVFLFISTNADKDENEWKNFVLKHPELKGIHFRIDDSIFDKNYQISSLPRYILIDKKGKIVNAFVNDPNEKLKSIIEELLKE